MLFMPGTEFRIAWLSSPSSSNSGRIPSVSTASPISNESMPKNGRFPVKISHTTSEKEYTSAAFVSPEPYLAHSFFRLAVLEPSGSKSRNSL